MNVRTSVRARTLAIAVAAGSLIAVPLASPASAASSASCSKVTTPPVAAGKKAAVTFAQCTPATLSAGGSATFTSPPKGTNKGKFVFTLVWKNGKGKTLGLVTYGLAKGNGKCAKGTARIAITGKVTGGSGAAATIVKKNEAIAGSTCAVTTGAKLGSSSLEPGTKFKL